MRIMDVKQTKANYIVDVDGNYVLDLNQTQALGYVHDEILNNKMGTLAHHRFMHGTVDCTNLPPHDYSDLLRE